MNATVHWVPTSSEVYAVIYARHHAELSVHGTISKTGDSDGEKRFMTEWGLHSADLPLIKIDRRGDESCYFIAAVKDES